jgi:hypothetical protein
VNTSFKITAKVWLYPGEAHSTSSGQVAAWHFVTIEKEDAQEIKKEFIWPRRGFGAIPVLVKIGRSEWKTSIFPEKKGTYLLPLKKSVRISEEIKVADTVKISLKVLN